MATGYTRQSSANIQAGLPIQSADLNNEFNQAQSAFDITTGHDHSGSSAGTGAKISLASSVTSVLPLANGGSNANLTASNGGIFYSTATAGAILAGTATASQLLISGSSTTPAWSNLASLLTSSTGITLSGTTTVNIAFTSTTGSGAVVLATSPTLTGTLTAATVDATTYKVGGVSPTGSGAIVLSASPTLTGTITAGALTLSTALALASGGTGATTQVNAFANTSVVTSTLGQPGYIKFPNGLTMQWGLTASLGGGNNIAVTFPIAFGSNVTINATFLNDSAAIATAASVTVNGFTATSSRFTTGQIYWFAIGS